DEQRCLGEYGTDNPVRAKFKQKMREGGKVKEYDGEVTAFARPKHLGIRLYSPQFSVQVDYRLTPRDSGTHLDYAADVSCGHWFVRVMVRIFSFFMRGIVKKQLRQLKQLAEAGD